jgi:hypothetical protein
MKKTIPVLPGLLLASCMAGLAFAQSGGEFILSGGFRANAVDRLFSDGFEGP